MENFPPILTVMCKMKNIYQKAKNWYRGQTPYSIGQMIGQAYNLKRGINQKPIPPEFEPPLIARILNPIGRFWLRRWPILLPIIVGAIIALFIHFDSKPNSKTPQKHERVPAVQTRKK